MLGNLATGMIHSGFPTLHHLAYLVRLDGFFVTNPFWRSDITPLTLGQIFPHPAMELIVQPDVIVPDIW